MRIGIDFGGTKIEGILLGSDGQEFGRRRIGTPRDDYAGSLQAIAGLIGELESNLDRPATVGLGIPGCISPASGRVKNANSTWLIGQDLLGDLNNLLKRRVRIENDANCLAVSEAIDGAGAGCNLVFGVILGTGVGGGIAIGGEAWTGGNAIAGEWGHNPLPWPADDERPGPDCYCGRQGCIETYLSGPGLRSDHRRSSGKDLDPHEIIAAMAAGAKEAERSFTRYTSRLARSLATVINLLDPDAIVLAGGLSNIDLLYELLPPLLSPYVFSDRCDTPIRRAKHGDSSGVRGAAWLWPTGK